MRNLPLVGAIAFGILLPAVVQQAVAQQAVGGKAVPLQADQINLGGQRISIFGIDAPDPDQDRECTLNGQLFGCFSNARRFLAAMLDLGEVACIDSGKRNYVNFPYMTCTINGKDIGEELVRNGHALAFLPQSTMYVEAEKAAKAAKLGIWQQGVRFSTPWLWRVDNGRPVDGP